MAENTDSPEVKRYDPNPVDVQAKAGQAGPKKPITKEQFLEIQKKLAGELKKIFEAVEKTADKFTKDLQKKYKKELLGVVIVPPRPKPKNPKAPKKPTDLNPELFVILDIQKGGSLKEQVKKATPIFKDIIEKGKSLKTDKGPIRVNPILLDEIWDACLKGHYEVLRLITTGKIIHDTGWLKAIKAVELHKTKVLERLDKYVVSYVITGSVVKGNFSATSDLDTYVIIDDTDVTRMTSNELLFKLRNMINTMAFEIETKLGTKNRIHTQVHVLTDVWNSIKNANPVVFTFLRDGIPLYDRGMYGPWKLLLKKGKVTPSPEAIDTYLKSGRLALDRVKAKLREIAMEDLHWATVTPTQGILMLLGVPPIAPREVSAKIREHLVKPGLLEEKYAKTWDDLFKIRKDIEHKKIKDLDPKLVLDSNNRAKEYLDRLEKLFKEVEKAKIKESVDALYEKTMESAQAAIKMVGSKAEKKSVPKVIEQELVKKKLAPKSYLDLVNKIVELNKSLDTSRQEIASLEFEEDRLSKDVFNLIKAAKGKNVEKYKVIAEYSGGKKRANVWFFGTEAFLLEDVSKQGSPVKKYSVSKKGGLQEPKASSLKIVEKKLSTFAGAPTQLTEDTISSLRTILGSDVRLILG